MEVPFDKTKLKDRKERIKKTAEGEVAGKTTKGAIDAMQAAVAASVIITATHS